MAESLTRRYAARLLGGVVGMPINALMQSIAARALGPAGLGSYSYLVGFFTDVIAFIDSGLGMAHYRRICQGAVDEAEWIAFFWRLVSGLLCLIAGATALLIVIGAGPWCWPSQPTLVVWLGLAVATLTWIVSLVGKASDAWGHTRMTEISRVWIRLVTLGLIAGITAAGWLGLREYFYVQVVSLLLLCVVWAGQLRRRGQAAILLPRWRSAPSDRAHLREAWDFSGPLLLYSLVGMLGAQFDRWILLRTAGEVEVGYYAASWQIGALCFVFSGALTQLLVGEYTRAISNNDLPRLRHLFTRTVGSLYVVSAFLGIFAAVNGGEVIALYAGERYRAGAVTMAIVCLYPLHQTYGQLSGSLFMARGDTRSFARLGIITSVLGAVATLVCVAPAGLDLGSRGLAVKMVLTQFVLVNLQLYHNTRMLEMQFTVLLRQQVAVAGALAIAALAARLLIGLGPALGSWQTLLGSAGLYTVLALAAVLGLDLAGVRSLLRERFPSLLGDGAPS